MYYDHVLKQKSGWSNNIWKFFFQNNMREKEHLDKIRVGHVGRRIQVQSLACVCLVVLTKSVETLLFSFSYFGTLIKNQLNISVRVYLWTLDNNQLINISILMLVSLHCPYSCLFSDISELILYFICLLNHWR